MRARPVTAGGKKKKTMPQKKHHTSRIGVHGVVAPNPPTTDAWVHKVKPAADAEMVDPTEVLPCLATNTNI
jgi:hypothetical protein